MKVAISVPDSLHRAAERVAKRLRLPRSQLYARALADYLKRQGRPEITERLNALYGRPGARPDAAILAYNLEMLRRVEWED